MTATNADGTNQALSAATARSPLPATAPANTKQPNPSGTAQDGQTVTVDNGSWSGQKPITFSYQWQSCTAANRSAPTSPARPARAILIGTSQVGSTLRATVTATNSAGKTSAFSNLTAAVVAKTRARRSTRRLPLISGSLLVGHTLQASTGTWTGLATNGFGYQWSRCNTNGTSCASISGATGQSYGVGQVDLGNALRVSVTATNSTGATSAISAASVIAATARPDGRLQRRAPRRPGVSRPHRTPRRAPRGASPRSSPARRSAGR